LSAAAPPRLLLHHHVTGMGSERLRRRLRERGDAIRANAATSATRFIVAP
jgi:hypothetical protein